MNYPRMPVARVRAAFKETVQMVAYQGQRVILTHHEVPMAILVPIEDLQLLELGDAQVFAEMDAAAKSDNRPILEDGEPKSLDQVAATLGEPVAPLASSKRGTAEDMARVRQLLDELEQDADSNRALEATLPRQAESVAELRPHLRAPRPALASRPATLGRLSAKAYSSAREELLRPHTQIVDTRPTEQPAEMSDRIERARHRLQSITGLLSHRDLKPQERAVARNSLNEVAELLVSLVHECNEAPPSTHGIAD